MQLFFNTLQIVFGILAPLIVTLLLLSAYQAISAWAEQKKWDARYSNPKDRRRTQK